MNNNSRTDDVMDRASGSLYQRSGFHRWHATEPCSNHRCRESGNESLPDCAQYHRVKRHLEPIGIRRQITPRAGNFWQRILPAGFRQESMKRNNRFQTVETEDRRQKIKTKICSKESRFLCLAGATSIAYIRRYFLNALGNWWMTPILSISAISRISSWTFSYAAISAA